MISCLLCGKSVSRGQYDSHRRNCATDNCAYLDSLPRAPGGMRCQRCRNPLRLWPKPADGAPQFFGCSARHPTCPVMSPTGIINDGASRYTCFRCNYNMCLMCLTRRLQCGERSRTLPENIPIPTWHGNETVWYFSALPPGDEIVSHNGDAGSMINSPLPTPSPLPLQPPPMLPSTVTVFLPSEEDDNDFSSSAPPLSALRIETPPPTYEEVMMAAAAQGLPCAH